MSEETKKAAKQVQENVKVAGDYLNAAKEHAARTKDPALIQKVTKLADGAKEVHETIKTNLDPKNG